MELINYVDVMSRVKHLMTAARSKELPEAYRTVYKEVFGLLTTEMLVNSAPITLPRLLPMVEILLEVPIMSSCLLQSCLHRQLPTFFLRKQRLDEDPVELRRLYAVCPNSILNGDGVESHVECTTRLHTLCQKFQDYLPLGLQLKNDGFFLRQRNWRCRWPVISTRRAKECNLVKCP